MVKGTMLVVAMRAEVPLMVNWLEILAVPVVPLRRMSAEEVAVVD